MYGSQDEKWKEIFGGAWQRVTEFCPEIGGFLVNHESNSVLFDNNAKMLTKMNHSPDYEKAQELIDKLTKHSDRETGLSARIIARSGVYTAGIFKRCETNVTDRKKWILPVCEMSRLTIALTQNTAQSLLALIELKMSDGRELSEYHIFGALTAIIKSAPENTMLSAHSANRFWIYIPDFKGSGNDFLSQLMDVVKNTFAEDESGSSPAGRYVTFSAGIGEDGAMPAKRMSTAEFALYEAGMSGTGDIVSYSSEQYETDKSEYERTSRFLRLVNENLFLYYFQPIVSAKDGEIIAYEMLMRSDSSIGMFPLEILDCAEKTKRLYDIEKATMRNALSIIERNQDILKERKLFVNSITAHMLTDEDWEVLEEEYGELMEKMVIEFTEQTEIDDQSLEKIRTRLGRSKIKIAIDDFGTGYSNTSNLIKYSPDYVKIDRSLIEGIDSKPIIRKLVSGFIEFIHENGYQALAEGVETYEELQTMIQLGSDLIQGYYTSKPKPVMLLEISNSICGDIKTINLSNSDSISRPYHPEEGEEVDLCLIKSDGYNSVFIETENVTLKGRKDIFLDTLIMIKNEIKTRITLENVHIKTEKDFPTIALGEGAEVELAAEGENDFDGRGIYVPQSSSLLITGNGELKVTSNRDDCYAIGVDSNSSPGNIVINISGKLNVKANGDSSVAIGGGKNESSNIIRVLSGDISITCTGRRCVGIGIASGNSIIDMENCKCSLDINAPDVVGIGSFDSSVDIDMKHFSLSETFNGIKIAGVGTIENGGGRIAMSDGSMNGVMKGRVVNCVGSRGGRVNCHVKNSDVTLYCEGSAVSGVGDIYGEGDVILEEAGLNFNFRTSEAFAYGSRSGLVKCVNSIEDIRINA